jgi:hypothetical protein
VSNKWGAIRANVIAAIQALPGINGTPVKALGIPADAFRLELREVIGVCLAEDEWDTAARGIADYRDNPATINVPIVILATSEWPPESAQSDDGKIEDLTAAILGSNTVGGPGPGIRGVNVGTSETGAVYLAAVKSQIIPDKNRAEGSGGAIAKVLEMRSTVLPL